MTDLTDDEQANVRAALRFLRLRYGSWSIVAKALGVKADSLSQVYTGRRGVTPRLAFAVARFGQARVDDLLAGRYPPARMCPACGHVGETRAAPIL